MIPETTMLRCCGFSFIFTNNAELFELREMVNKNAVDIIGNFGEACREEFRSM